MQRTMEFLTFIGVYIPLYVLFSKEHCLCVHMSRLLLKTELMFMQTWVLPTVRSGKVNSQSFPVVDICISI